MPATASTPPWSGVGDQPGGCMLVIVGASHKWYLQAYLDQMHDVRIVPTDAVLR